MAVQAKGAFASRPKSKTPAERSVEFDAIQARLKAEALARHAERVAKARAKRAD